MSHSLPTKMLVSVSPILVAKGLPKSLEILFGTVMQCSSIHLHPNFVSFRELEFSGDQSHEVGVDSMNDVS